MEKIQGTILNFNLDEYQEDIVPDEKEINLDSLKKMLQNQAEIDLQKKINKGNNLIDKWKTILKETTEEVISSEAKKWLTKIEKKEVELHVLKKQKEEQLYKIFTKEELFEFKKKLDLKESNKFEKEYTEVINSIAVKKSHVKPTMRNILLRYLIIHEKIKSNTFNWDELLILTKALS